MVDFLARTRQLATYTVTTCEVLEAHDMMNDVECYENVTRASASMLCMAKAWIDGWHMSWGAPPSAQVEEVAGAERRNEAYELPSGREPSQASWGMVRERPRAI